MPCRLDVIEFDGSGLSAELRSALGRADRLLICVPPCAQVDPVLAACGEDIARLPRLQSIVYLSTTGVYGDHAGAEVDETTPPSPLSSRGRARLQAERAWQEFGARAGASIAVLRLAGIYGPGRNTLIRLAQGRAVRVVKPNQVFNRIHVADVAQAIHAAFEQQANGIFNVADDEPCAPEQVVAYGAKLMGIPIPPSIPFSAAESTLPAMTRSFYAESKRVRNAKLKEALGVRLIYPTYRCGLATLGAT